MRHLMYMANIPKPWWLHYRNPPQEAVWVKRPHPVLPPWSSLLPWFPTPQLWSKKHYMPVMNSHVTKEPFSADVIAERDWSKLILQRSMSRKPQPMDSDYPIDTDNPMDTDETVNLSKWSQSCLAYLAPLCKACFLSCLLSWSRSSSNLSTCTGKKAQEQNRLNVLYLARLCQKRELNSKKLNADHIPAVL